MPDEAAYSVLLRAKQTHNECGAVYRYKRHGEPYDWCDGLRCNQEPGHDGPHWEWMQEYGHNTSYGSVHPGGVDVSHWTDDGNEGGNLPSPWTPEELAFWREV